MWLTRSCRSCYSSCIKERWTWSKPSCSHSCRLRSRCRLKASQPAPTIITTRNRWKLPIQLTQRTTNFMSREVTISIILIPVEVTPRNITDRQRRRLYRQHHLSIISRWKVKQFANLLLFANWFPSVQQLKWGTHRHCRPLDRSAPTNLWEWESAKTTWK